LVPIDFGSTSPDPIAGFKGPTSKERGGKRREGREGINPLYFLLLHARALGVKISNTFV